MIYPLPIVALAAICAGVAQLKEMVHWRYIDTNRFYPPVTYFHKKFNPCKTQFCNTLQFITFPGYEISYPENGSMVIKMMLSAPSILRKIKLEHKFLEKIIKEYSIDIVISDNRYGLWSETTKCVFITHQISIQVPKWLKLFEANLFNLNKRYIDKYSECWIPDFKGGLNLSGKLSDKSTSFKNEHEIIYSCCAACECALT